MKTETKQKLIPVLKAVSALLEKCGGPGGTPGPCPTGHAKPGGGEKPGGVSVSATEKAVSSSNPAFAASKKLNPGSAIGDPSWTGSSAYHANQSTMASSKITAGLKHETDVKGLRDRHENAEKAHRSAEKHHQDAAEYHLKKSRSPGGSSHKAAADLHKEAARHHGVAMSKHQDAKRLLLSAPSIPTGWV